MRTNLNKDRRWPRAVVMASCAWLLLSGCGGYAQSEPSPGEAAAQGYPVSVENCGRTLTFDHPPSRVMTSYQPNLEVLLGLGVGDRVISRTEFPGADLVPLPPPLQQQLEAIPLEQSSANRLPTKERAVSLGPDFVLSGGYYEMEATEGFATREEWAEAGVPVYLSQCSGEQGTAITVEDTYREILDLGRIFWVSAAAEQRVEQIRAQIADVRARVADREPLNVLVVYTTDDPPLVQGASVEGRIVELAGGVNVLADQPQFFPANDEAIAALDVDAFLIFPGESPVPERLYQRYPTLAGSRNQRVVTANYTLTGGGVAGAWRIGDAVEQLARQLHPEAFDR